MIDVKMPQFGMGISEVRIVRWLKAVGDQVAEDEPLIEIETAKTTAEVVAPASGKLIRLLAGEDETVEVYAVVAHLEAD